MRNTSHVLRMVSLVLAVYSAPAVALDANAGNTAASITLATANAIYPGAINCGNPQWTSAINNAFLAVSGVLTTAITKIENDERYPPFLAMFRLPVNKPDVLEFFRLINDLGTKTQPPKVVSTRPGFTCAEVGTPLYRQCTYLPFQEDLFVDLVANTIVFCPSWFTRPANPTPMQCPAVTEGNEFSRNAQGSVFGASRSTRMMEALVGLYLRFDTDLRMYPALRALFNIQEAMKLPFYHQPTSWWNNVGFLSLEINGCTNVPDVSKPPWKNPRLTLNTTGVDCTPNTPGVDLTLNTTGVDCTLNTTGVEFTLNTTGVDTTGVDFPLNTTGVDFLLNTTGVELTLNTTSVDFTLNTTGVDFAQDTTGVDVT